MKRNLGTKGTIIAAAGLLVLTGLLFRQTIALLVSTWEKDNTYSHGFLVPFFSLFLLYDRRERMAAAATGAGTGAGGSAWGAAALAAAIAGLFAARLSNIFFMQAIMLIVAVAAVALLAGGWRFLRLSAMPIAFLIFMCPLPSALYDRISGDLRLLASGASTLMLQVSGVAATSTGNIIYLPSATLSVEDACSGIRSLFGILATATAFALLTAGGKTRKVFFVLSAAPIAVAANIMRVTGTGLLNHYASPALAEGFYHYLEGWVFYVAALAMLLVEYWVLKVIFPMDAPVAPVALDAPKAGTGATGADVSGEGAKAGVCEASCPAGKCSPSEGDGGNGR